MAEQKHVVVGITGSVAVSHSPDILKGLQDQGIKVSVVMTKNAEQFIPSGSFADILDGNVFTDMFVPASEEKQMPHISLAKEADALLIAPATANIIGKMAHGLADDLLTCIVLATKAKILLAPAMNTQMYENKIVQENIKKLESTGMQFIHPIEGQLACGDYGAGHIADTETIIHKVMSSLK